MQRLVITGWPRAGKTTLANKLKETRLYDLEQVDSKSVYHLDVLFRENNLGWSEQSDTAAMLFNALPIGESWIVEGVTAIRAIRKWLVGREPGAKPFNRVLYIAGPYDKSKPLTPGQRAMGAGCDTALSDVTWELTRRGIRVDVIECLAEHRYRQAP